MRLLPCAIHLLNRGSFLYKGVHPWVLAPRQLHLPNPAFAPKVPPWGMCWLTPTNHHPSFSLSFEQQAQRAGTVLSFSALSPTSITLPGTEQVSNTSQLNKYQLPRKTAEGHNSGSGCPSFWPFTS